MRNFRQLEIWNKGILVVKQTYTLTGTLPDNEKFGLISQMQRCSVSIPSNIAEGCSRNSEIEFKRFLEIALGSAFELETQLILCSEIGFLDNETLQNALSELHPLQKQLNTLVTKIANST